MSAWTEHKAKWSDCQLCPLCEVRTKIVLLRGSLPAPLLFVGEAPGDSEDIIGKPFIGPAGKLLDSMIAKAEENTSKSVPYAMTNLVSCIPKGDDGNKAGEPPEESIKACSDRLREIIGICSPKLIVCVGKLAGKWVPKIVDIEQYPDSCEIHHPAFIMRLDISQKPLAIQRTIVAIGDAIESAANRLSSD